MRHRRGIVRGHHVTRSIHPVHGESIHCLAVPLVVPVDNERLSLGRQIRIPPEPSQLVHPRHCAGCGHNQVLLPCYHHHIQRGLVQQTLN